MAELRFDELNVLKELREYRNGNFDNVSTKNAELFRRLGIISKTAVENAMYEWFYPMGIPMEDIERRINLACDFEDSFIEMLIIFSIAEENGEPLDFEQMEQKFFESYGTAIGKYLPQDKRLKAEDLVDRKFTFAEEVTTSTQNGMANPYSQERAITMATTETSVALDDADYKEAIKQGCTKKSWNTIIDGRERLWHFDADGQEVPIDEYFIVDGELMKHPHDPTASAKNLCNCRCWCTYK